ncbi:hypothetical protein [Rathayibacter rathayi]|uniref:hypothetical protein n=1 Tax=Rathayibacter rathayi TaxID=33887 RepID=UPI000CE818FE|nr:hypothetical protein [Rathayibacter rathayi]PPF46360.1 hypothetical protein C5C08_11750 [Rathayibacter rathayi]
MQVKRTTDGTTADPGRIVTVTLSDGYTFADGSTSYSGSTNINGLLSLPDISVPAKGGTSTFSATSNALTTSAPVSAPAVGGSLYKYEDSKVTSTGATNVAKVVVDGTGGVYAITASGDLVDTKGSVITSGLDATNGKALTIALAAGPTPVPYFIKDGDLYKYQDSKVTKLGATKLAQIVANGTGGVYGITKGGDLVSSDGTKITSGLDPKNDQALTIALAAGPTPVPYFIKDGDLYKYQDSTVTKLDATKLAKVITDGTGGVYGITTAGALVNSSGGSADTGLDPDNDEGLTLAKASSGPVPYYLKDGKVYKYQDDTVTELKATNVTKLVADGTGAIYGITKNGALVTTDGGEITTGVTTGSDEGLTLAKASSGPVPFFIKAPTC